MIVEASGLVVILNYLKLNKNKIQASIVACNSNIIFNWKSRNEHRRQVGNVADCVF